MLNRSCAISLIGCAAVALAAFNFVYIDESIELSEAVDAGQSIAEEHIFQDCGKRTKVFLRSVERYYDKEAFRIYYDATFSVKYDAATPEYVGVLIYPNIKIFGAMIRNYEVVANRIECGG